MICRQDAGSTLSATRRNFQRGSQWLTSLVLLTAIFLSGCKTPSHLNESGFSRFIGLDDFSSFARSQDEQGYAVLLSPEIASAIDFNQLIVSWNADAPTGTFLTVEARAMEPDHQTKFYTLGRWTPDNAVFPRTSVHGQTDTDGKVATDTLVLNHPAHAIQIRLTLGGTNSSAPSLKFLGLSFCNTRAPKAERPPNHAAWGKLLVTPEISQESYPQQQGWCSPTAVSMVLGYWVDRLHRPELKRDVPEVAAAVYDDDYAGTGNWPFNTAYGGSFPGMRAFVTRFDDLDELEDWVAAGIPVIVSARWNLLQPGRPDTGNGHLVVCIGFIKDGDVVVNDPATNLKTSRIRHIYGRENVRRAWATSNNTVYLIFPVGTDLPMNRYRQW